jgi:hypothetical protein
MIGCSRSGSPRPARTYRRNRADASARLSQVNDGSTKRMLGAHRAAANTLFLRLLPYPLLLGRQGNRDSARHMPGILTHPRSSNGAVSITTVWARSQTRPRGQRHARPIRANHCRTAEPTHGDGVSHPAPLRPGYDPTDDPAVLVEPVDCPLRRYLSESFIAEGQAALLEGDAEHRHRIRPHARPAS